MNARRIVMNGRCLHRPVTGVERYASELIKRLASRVTVVEPAGARDGLRGHLWEQWTLPGLVEGALLWCPANTGPLTVACQVVTIHDVSPLDHPEWFHPAFARWYRVLLPALGRKVRRILTDSAFSRHRIVETLGVPADRVVAIPCGVDARFSPAAPESIDAVRRRYSLPRRYLLTVGSLQPRKNLSRLFEAWASVRLHVTGIELAVIGAGRHTFRSPAIGRIPDGVRLLGRVDDADLPALYSGAIAAVVPSLYEGFGLTALEAMACGTPVVAATGSALDEVAADVTVRIDPTSTSSLRDGLQMVIDDDGLRQRLATAGRDRARGYTWERTATATWQVLEAASGD